MFFQVGLLVGYIYAHLMACYVKSSNQIFLHAALLATSLIFLPITPDVALKPAGGEDPVWGIICLLIFTVGAPYVLISSTGPLLQHWYSLKYVGKSPYRLYALSNLGSLLGLITYPFLVEPHMVLGAQTIFWSCGYLFFVGACLWSGRFLLSGNQPVPEGVHSKAGAKSKVGMGDPLLWVGLSACGSVTLLAITSKITQDISVIPFLWVLPLSLYLCTFIIAFDSPKWYRRRIWLPAFLLSIALVIYLLYPETELSILPTITLYCAAMFCIIMVCHGELVRSTPPACQLTFFFLMVSLGGAAGGAFVSFVATKCFPAYWELQVGISIALILIGFSLFRLRAGEAGRWRAAYIAAWSTITVVSIVLLVIVSVETDGDALVTRRNFYGVLRVFEEDKGTKNHCRMLYNGQINHGLQLFHPIHRNRIVSYYSAHSGLGIAFSQHPKRLGRIETVFGKSQEAFNLRVGVVGLGIGVVASWGLPGDTIRFYEINPEVVQLANEFFTVLEDAEAEVEVVTGDARISLERELRKQGSQQFDILVVDAFSGDAIPVHLITREAFKLYFKHLSADGILALHISNRHLDLLPVVNGLSKIMDIPALLVIKESYYEGFIKGSEWVLLTRNEHFLQEPEVLKYAVPWQAEVRDKIVWTDNYSSLLNVLK
ncbi:MAG: hypothetical protein D3924_01675 [Candidatus Electrothrix sp. AR4]|nr:hypothetical protein [Candidatus Electrothrix sp. AR4]